MTGADLLPPAILKRKAIVYVRQSTQAQVQLNLESQRRQYELVDEARRRGFRDVEVIDDDWAAPQAGRWPALALRSSSPGCARGTVGAVLCFDATGSPATAAIGITCLSSADWLRRE